MGTENLMRFVGVFNRDGGTFRTMDMDQFSAEATRILGEHGHSIEIELVEGKQLIAALERAVARKDVDVLLAGGGDGTISAAAEAAFRSGMPLAVLPAGTMNLFARSLHLPLDLPGALNAIATGEVRAVDIATANGKPFVHQYSVGIHTRLVRIREEMTYQQPSRENGGKRARGAARDPAAAEVSGRDPEQARPREPAMLGDHRLEQPVRGRSHPARRQARWRGPRGLHRGADAAAANSQSSAST